ncbi:Crp/Fnr family transcriptional regulator [Defluviitalea phaphyphila]|uniref:Crp/Fnr family transcriptional regulator n=1 Tax=Defluviitalea phaphyphila TaxID=1473580 RepID=UPI000731E177|nr:Crp/Fnr family transcriptional regulator [Defluviitalea phaphyphila]
MKNHIEALRHIPIFSRLSEDQLIKISNLEIKKEYKKGEKIFLEGEKGKAFYYIQSGKIKMYKTSFDGREIILNIFGKGDIIAEVTMFNDMEYPATAEVIEDAIVGMIYNKDIEKMVLENRELSLQIIKELSRRLYHSQANVKEMALHDSYIRTIKVLIKLAKQYGKNTSKGIELELGMTRQDIANIVGTTRETSSRIMSQLKKKNYIDVDGKTIIIKDLKKLEDELER